MSDMNANSRFTALSATLAVLLLACISPAAETVKVQDLAGQWQGTNRFTGISYEETSQKKVTPQDVEVVLRISADGKATGRVGGAELSGCAVESNRGWLGRRLNIKTDFVIRGRMIGAVATGSANETNTISAPFNVQGNQMKGTFFVIHPFKYPYPILDLRLSR